MKKIVSLISSIALGAVFLASCQTILSSASSSAESSAFSSSLSSASSSPTASSSSASSAGSSASASSSSAAVLAVPQNISLTGHTVIWDPVEGALSYNVRVNESDVYAAAANRYELDPLLHGLTEIEVQSVAGDLVSAYSAPRYFPVYLTLSAPTNLRQDGNLVLWDPVPFATGYIIKIDGVEYPVSGTSYAVNPATMRSVAVLAVGDGLGGYVLSSPYSDPITLMATLAAPTGLAFANGVLSWQAVAGASGYEVTINGGDPISVSVPSLTIGYEHIGDVIFAVRALGDATHLPSSWATATIHISPLTLSAPTNLAIEDGVLTFDAVPYADDYVIYVDGSQYATIEATSYALPADLLAQPASYIQVQAVSSIHNPSPLSAKIFIGSIEISDEAGLRAMTGEGQYVLSTDLILTSDWVPIALSGSFDGQGHRISGISIGTAGKAVGFFSEIDGGKVRNLSLQGSIAVTLNENGSCVGGLAGKSSGGSCVNVRTDFAITVSSPNGLSYVGGFVGKASDSSFSQTISQAAITASDCVAGGFAGLLADSAAPAAIMQAKALGSLTASGGTAAEVGGFVGHLHDSLLAISQCVASLDVTGPATVGGFVGYLGTGRIDNSYAEGSVTASAASFVQIGGFIGRAEGYNSVISHCLSYMTVAYASGSGNYAGAFVGVTPGGTYARLYADCHYDSTLCGLDRIGNPSNGVGDGIGGVASTGWPSLTNFDAAIWNFSGTRPVLAWELSNPT